MKNQLACCALVLLMVTACAPLRPSGVRFDRGTTNMSANPTVSIRFTDPMANVQDVLAGRISPNDELLWETDENGRKTQPYVVARDLLISGSRIQRAAAGFAPNDRDPVVNVALDERGTKALADITMHYVNRLLVFVVGDRVVSAPVIREPILSGMFQISGNLTVETARALATRLNSIAAMEP